MRIEDEVRNGPGKRNPHPAMDVRGGLTMGFRNAPDITEVKEGMRIQCRSDDTWYTVLTTGLNEYEYCVRRDDGQLQTKKLQFLSDWLLDLNSIWEGREYLRAEWSGKTSIATILGTLMDDDITYVVYHVSCRGQQVKTLDEFRSLYPKPVDLKPPLEVGDVVSIEGKDVWLFGKIVNVDNLGGIDIQSNSMDIPWHYTTAELAETTITKYVSAEEPII